MGGGTSGSFSGSAQQSKWSCAFLWHLDLRPISRTTINESLGPTETDAIEVSPIFAPFPFACAAEVLVGREESPSYHSQAIASFDYLVDKGSRVELITIDGLDHFDIILSGQHLKSFLRLTNR
jgi:acetyl esterase/lipase